MHGLRFAITMQNSIKNNPRFQFLQLWKKKNPNGNFLDLAEVFRLAKRMDMVDATHRVAGEEAAR